VHLWDPPFCGDIDMRIAKDGTWFHEGRPIRRQALAKLFSTILMTDDSAEFFLVTPVEKVRIEVEDCPFVANQMEIIQSEGQQQIVLTTNMGEILTVDSEHPIKVTSTGAQAEPHPIVHVRNGLQALINRPVFYRLVEAAVENDSNELGVWSKGQFFSLGKTEK
jgi:uncharacterized protein